MNDSNSSDRSASARLARIGAAVPEIVLPRDDVDLSKYCVIACDQFTSSRSYWNEVEKIVNGSPSTLRCVLPEIYLKENNVSTRIADTHRSMSDYLNRDVLHTLPPGFILTSRHLEDGTVRNGLMIAIDLEQYDFATGSRSLVRATEKTIVERLPARVDIRRGAPLEFPHVLVLVDDVEKTLIEPLVASTRNDDPVYETQLILGGGTIEGRHIGGNAEIEHVAAALERLADPQRFSSRYGDHSVILFPVGDGNHSLAAAKQLWEELKSAGVSPDHPARYALVELVNLHSDGLSMHPIHRTITTAGSDLLRKALLGAGFVVEDDTTPFSERSIRLHDTSGSHRFQLRRTDELTVAAVDSALGSVVDRSPGIEIDYVHGTEEIREAVARQEIAVELPSIDRDLIIPTVLERGALPRKAFSLGEAEEKRYYLEARRITED